MFDIGREKVNVQTAAHDFALHIGMKTTLDFPEWARIVVNILDVNGIPEEKIKELMQMSSITFYVGLFSLELLPLTSTISSFHARFSHNRLKDTLPKISDGQIGRMLPDLCFMALRDVEAVIAKKRPLDLLIPKAFFNSESFIANAAYSIASSYVGWWNAYLLKKKLVYK